MNAATKLFIDSKTNEGVANLTNADLEGANLKYADLTNAKKK